MTYSYLYGSYFYKKEIEDMIDHIEELRKNKREKKIVLKTTFAEDLKNKIAGIEEKTEKTLFDNVVKEIEENNSDKSYFTRSKNKKKY